MAQAAKQLKKIKDIEAQALQEQKEKEESNRKRRNRSRDRKKKVRGGRRRQPGARGALEVAAGGRGSADLRTRWGRGDPGAGGVDAAREWRAPGGRGGGKRLRCGGAEDRARGWKGREGGQEAEGAQKPARSPASETFQHLGQMPAGPRRSGSNFSGFPAAREGDGLLRSGSPPLLALQGSWFGEMRLRVPEAALLGASPGDPRSHKESFVPKSLNQGFSCPSSTLLDPGSAGLLTL